MKLEINRTEFLKAWQMAEHSSNVKSAMNAVSGILINAGDAVTLEATDFKTAIRCTASGVQTVEAGSAVLPVRLFGDFLKKIQSDTATLEVVQERGTLTAGRNKMRFSTFPVSEFPNIPRSDSASALADVLAVDLMRAINEGSVASSTPVDFPKYLGTCLVKVQENLMSVVSTDSKRLSISKCPCESRAEREMMLPIPALKELNRLTGLGDPESHVQILNDGSTAWFRLEGVEFSIRCVESAFPNYERILTSDVLTTLRVRKDEILPALERLDIIARNTPAHLVVLRLSPGGELEMTAKAPDFGTAFEVLSASIDGDPLRVGFNLTYLQDGVRALRGGEVTVEFNGEEGQTRVLQEDSDSFLYMLMPARIAPQDLLEAGEEDAAMERDQQA